MFLENARRSFHIRLFQDLHFMRCVAVSLRFRRFEESWRLCPQWLNCPRKRTASILQMKTRQSFETSRDTNNKATHAPRSQFFLKKSPIKTHVCFGHPWHSGKGLHKQDVWSLFCTSNTLSQPWHASSHSVCSRLTQTYRAHVSWLLRMAGH